MEPQLGGDRGDLREKEVLRGPVLGGTELLRWGTQADPGSEGAQRGRGNVGRTARTGESPETQGDAG